MPDEPVTKAEADRLLKLVRALGPIGEAYVRCAGVGMSLEETEAAIVEQAGDLRRVLEKLT